MIYDSYTVYQLYHIIYGEFEKEWNATKNINNILNMSFCNEITQQICSTVRLEKGPLKGRPSTDGNGAPLDRPHHKLYLKRLIQPIEELVCWIKTLDYNMT